MVAPAGPLPPALRQMEADVPFQRRFWRAQRVGWAAMALVVLAALLGLTGGDGWLARAEAESGDGALRLTYPRLQRLEAPVVLEAVLAAPAGADQRPVELFLDDGFLRTWRIDEMQPGPERATAEPGGGLRLVLERHGDDAGPLNLRIRASVQGGVGMRRALVALGDGPPVPLVAWTWP